MSGSTSMGNIVIRAAEPTDAPSMGRLHVRAWQAAYRGQMPDDYLDGLHPEQRAEMWAQQIASPGDGIRILVAERSGEVVGFAAVGPARDIDDIGELYAINVDPDNWGTGAGPDLLAAAEGALRDLGFGEAVLWVLPANDRARRFYERAHWRPEETVRTETILGVTVPEVRYRRSLS